MIQPPALDVSGTPVPPTTELMHITPVPHQNLELSKSSDSSSQDSTQLFMV